MRSESYTNIHMLYDVGNMIAIQYYCLLHSMHIIKVSLRKLVIRGCSWREMLLIRGSIYSVLLLKLYISIVSRSHVLYKTQIKSIQYDTEPI